MWFRSFRRADNIVRASFSVTSWSWEILPGNAVRASRRSESKYSFPRPVTSWTICTNTSPQVIFQLFHLHRIALQQLFPAGARADDDAVCRPPGSGALHSINNFSAFTKKNQTEKLTKCLADGIKCLNRPCEDKKRSPECRGQLESPVRNDGKPLNCEAPSM